MRRVAVIAIVLLLAIIGAIASAWACVIGDTQPTYIFPRPTSESQQWPLDASADWPSIDGYNRSSSFGVLHEVMSGESAEGMIIHTEQLRAGWPFLALRWTRFERWTRTDPDSAILEERFARGFLVSPIDLRTSEEAAWEPLWLPIQVLPLGFLLNTLFISMLVLSPSALIRIPSKSKRCLQRSYWRRTGRCERCGYDVTAVAVCPECGRAVRRSVAPTGTVGTGATESGSEATHG